MNLSNFIVQILAGLSAGAVLFLVASGLTLVFGALRIINFAHGSFYMLGAFLMYSIGGQVGFSNVTFWISLLLAALCVAIVGGVVEVVVLRPIYSRPMFTQLVVTFGLVLIAAGVLRGLYGPIPRVTPLAPMLQGSVGVLDRRFPLYQLILIGLATMVVVSLWALLYRTNWGRMIRAAVSDSQLLSLSGANVPLLFTAVFVAGAFLAGLAGASVASQGAVSVGMDINVIIRAFIVIIIGGVGSLTGALVGAMLVGVTEALVILWLPGASLMAAFGVLIIVLLIRPRGLFGTTAH